MNSSEPPKLAVQDITGILYHAETILKGVRVFRLIYQLNHPCLIPISSAISTIFHQFSMLIKRHKIVTTQTAFSLELPIFDNRDDGLA